MSQKGVVVSQKNRKYTKAVNIMEFKKWNDEVHEYFVYSSLCQSANRIEQHDRLYKLLICQKVRIRTKNQTEFFLNT